MYRFHPITMLSLLSSYTSSISRSCSIFSRCICSPPCSHPQPSPLFIFSASLLDCLLTELTSSYSSSLVFFPYTCLFLSAYLGERVQHCNTAAGASKADTLLASLKCMVSTGDQQRYSMCLPVLKP